MIYLDNNATTALDPVVLDAMLPLFQNFNGNPSSVHQYGQRAKGLLTQATRDCAHFFGVSPDEVLFTSGATEGLNFLIRSLPRQGHVITSSIEHVAVLEPLKFSGCSVSYLTPEPGSGKIRASQIKEVIQKETVAIILTAANNETGVITEELEEIADLAYQAHISLIIDGVACLGKEEIKLHRGLSAICFSGHKIHGPLGVGLIVVRKTFKTHPLIIGGPQQRGLRAGTENLPAIVGFAKALEIIRDKQLQERLHMTYLRDRLERGLVENLSDIQIHGQLETRLCNTTNIAFTGVDGETLLIKLDLAGLAASHGSACSSGTLGPSRVLLNMGIAPKIARSSLRFSLSRFTTEEEILTSINLITHAVNSLR